MTIKNICWLIAGAAFWGSLLTPLVGYYFPICVAKTLAMTVCYSSLMCLFLGYGMAYLFGFPKAGREFVSFFYPLIGILILLPLAFLKKFLLGNL